MRPGRVVILLPNPGNAFRMAQRVKLVDTETFDPEPAVEAFDGPIPPGLPWRDKHPVHLDSPFAKGARDEFWSVVHAECSWHTAFDDEDIELVDEVFCGDRVLHFPAQCFSGVFTNDREDLERFAGRGLVEWEINSPHIPWGLRPGDGGQVRNPDSLLAASRDHPEAFFTS